MGQSNAVLSGPDGAGVLDVAVDGLLAVSLNAMWILVCSWLVFFMQCGFALMEAGSVRLKNTRNILLKNTIDACISALMWWAIGSALFGVDTCSGNPFLGTKHFFSAGVTTSDPIYWAKWLFSWAFSATSATVVSGAVAERTQFRAYVIYTLVITGWVYPIIAHWVWSRDGWLSPFRVSCASGGRDVTFSNTVGLIDFSGSGVVHMTGGAAALMGALITGPRLGRFTPDGHLVDLPPCNPAQIALGVFILWFGWYGFNPGSTQCVYGCMQLAARVGINTTLGAGAGGLTSLLVTALTGAPGDIIPILNGILAGLVSVTGACAVVEPYAAVAIGAIGGVVYMATSRMLLKLRIDDPLDAGPVHLFCGVWGVLASGFFATKAGVERAYHNTTDWGVFYGGAGDQLGIQFLGVVVIFAWSAFFTGGTFLLLRRLGWLRVSRDDEEQGLDYVQGIGKGVPIWARRTSTA